MLEISIPQQATKEQAATIAANRCPDCGRSEALYVLWALCRPGTEWWIAAVQCAWCTASYRAVLAKQELPA